MCSGVVPQQPPIILTKPSATKSRRFSAVISGVSSYPPNVYGKPADVENIQHVYYETHCAHTGNVANIYIYDVVSLNTWKKYIYTGIRIANDIG